MFRNSWLLALAWVFINAYVPLAKASTLYMENLMATCAPQVHPTTLQAIIRSESGGNLYLIGDNGNYRLPKAQRVHRAIYEVSPERAAQTAQMLINAGHVVDLSIGQINNRNLSLLGMTIRDAFDPCRNIAGAARLLTYFYSLACAKYGPGQRALLAAISMYNTGNFTSGFTNGYVDRVTQAAKLRVPELKVSSAPRVYISAPASRPRRVASSEVEDFM